MPIGVITDSTAGLPPEVAAEEGIIVVPCQVRIGQTVYREGVDLTTEELFRRMFSSAETPATSLPAGEDFLAAFEEARRRGYDQVLGVFVGSGFSGTLNAARLFAAQTPLEVAVVDSGTTALALGLLAVYGARRARQGVPLPALARELEGLAQGAELYALLDTLEYVRRGGRIGRVAEMVASVLHIKVVLRIARNQADVVARMRSRKRGLAWLQDVTREAAPLLGLGAMHTGGETEALAHELAEALADSVTPGGPVLVSMAGAALAVHAGPNAVGVALLRRP